jgi:hypothetical protein
LNISSPFHGAVWKTAFEQKRRISWPKIGCQGRKEQIRHFLAPSTKRLLKRLIWKSSFPMSLAPFRDIVGHPVRRI